jgi:hypothetical protein
VATRTATFSSVIFQSVLKGSRCDSR